MMSWRIVKCVLFLKCFLRLVPAFSLAPVLNIAVAMNPSGLTEKPTEITKQEWMEKLENIHLQRSDMNRLVMNYLVTGGSDAN